MRPHLIQWMFVAPRLTSVLRRCEPWAPDTGGKGQLPAHPHRADATGRWIIWIAQLAGLILATTVIVGMTRILPRSRQVPPTGKKMIYDRDLLARKSQLAAIWCAVGVSLIHINAAKIRHGNSQHCNG
jgi:hypothetical protein